MDNPCNKLFAALVVTFWCTSAFAAVHNVHQVQVYEQGEVDNQGLKYNCFRIPALIATSSGRVYAFAEGRRTHCNDHGDVRIVVRVSEDGGESWGDIMQVVSEEGHTIGNPAPVVDTQTSNGDDVIHLVYSRDNHQVFVTSTSDSAAGTGWSKSMNITSSVKRNPSATSWIATGPPGGVQIPNNGRLAICTNYKATDGNDYSVMVFSDDAGSSWNVSSNIPLGAARLNNECQMALGGGTSATDYTMYAFIRGENKDASSTAHHYQSVSTDGGLSWAPSAVATGVRGPECEGSIGRFPTKGGSFSYFATAPSGTSRYNMTVNRAITGTPPGGWQPVLSLWSGPAAYSSQQLLASGIMGVLYERGQSSAYESLYLAFVPFS